MKSMFLYGTAVLAFSVAPLFAQTGGGTPGQTGTTSGPSGTAQPPRTGGATDQGGSRPGPDLQGGSSAQPAPAPKTERQGGGAGAVDERDARVSPSSPDQTFVVEAARGGISAVELGRLATEKASNDRVKQFGRRMVTDHGKANEELRSLAQSKKITIPADLDAKRKATRDRLEKLSGEAFDRAYIQEMVGDHQQDVVDFRKESLSGKDADVKAWAAKTLPTLVEHMRMAQDISQSLGRPAVGTSGSNPTGANNPR